MDRVKAAIFSSLGEIIIGARVLDLFAGTGALGIEALSRGADSVLFVEEDRQSTAAIEKNLAKAGVTGRIRQQDVFDFLRNAGTAGELVPPSRCKPNPTPDLGATPNSKPPVGAMPLPLSWTEMR